MKRVLNFMRNPKLVHILVNIVLVQNKNVKNGFCNAMQL